MTFVIAVTFVVVTGCVSGQVWTSHNETSDWKCQSIRKQVNSTITLGSITADTLAGCCHHCSSTESPGVKLVSLYFDEETRRCFCNSGVDVDAGNETQPEIRYCSLDASLKIDKTVNQFMLTRTTAWPPHQHCDSIFNRQLLKDINALQGVYVIYPDGEGPVDVWCDGPNTVIQRRLGGDLNFNRSWSDYVNGFGDPTGDHWLGLKYLHLLTKIKSSLYILIDLLDGDPSVVMGPTGMLLYKNFGVGNGTSEYAFRYQRFFWLVVPIADLFHGQTNISFSTFDNDNDDSDQNLAAETQSGWWIGSISEANPNSPYVESTYNGATIRTLFRPKRFGYVDWHAKTTTMWITHMHF